MSRFLLRTFTLTLFASHLQATILAGQTVQTTYLFPDKSTVLAGPVNSLVGAGVELSNFAGFVNIDFSDTNILITTTRNAFVNNVAFDGLRFTDINGTIPAVTVSLNAATNYAGFDSSRISLGSNTLFVNVANLAGLQGQIISLDLTLATSVPEPAGFALSALAVGLLLLFRIRAAHRRLHVGVGSLFAPVAMGSRHLQ